MHRYRMPAYALLLAMAVVAPSICAKRVTLEVWSTDWVPFSVVLNAFKGFEAVNPGVDVTVHPYGANASYAQLLTRIAAGSPPDLVTMFTPLAQLSDKGLLLPLNAYMARSSRVKASNYDSGLLRSFSTAGTVYAVPSVENGPQLGLVYNKTHLQEAGFDPDQAKLATLDDLELAHRKLTRIEGGRITRWGLDPFGSIGRLYFPETWGAVFDAAVASSDGKHVLFDTPEMRKALEWASSFGRLVDRKQYAAYMGSAGDWGLAIAKGTKSMEINGYWTPGQIAALKKGATAGYTWVPNVRGDHLMLVAGFGLAIPKGSKHPDLAFKLIEYMATKVPAQAIFDGIGFLNGNRETLREMDFSKHPDVKWYTEALKSADRVQGFPDIPEWDSMKALFIASADKVRYGTASTADALRAAQAGADIILAKYMKQVKKYVK